MKKLLVMVAAAATALGLQASGSPSNGTSFEAVMAGSTLQNLVDADTTCGSWDFAIGTDPEATFTQTTYDSVGDTPKLSSYRPVMFSSEQQEKFLQVKTSLTNGVFRTPGSGSMYDYADLLVKFTCYDYDDVPDVPAGTKLVFWAQISENESSTNIMVTAGYWNGESLERKDYNCGVLPDPEAWHRVTVKAVNDVSGYNSGFIVFLDGVNGGPSNYALSSDEAKSTPGSAAWNLTPAAQAWGKALFPSLVKGYPAAISQVGFAGQGGIDDITQTDTTPFSCANDPVSFTIEPIQGIASFVVSNADNTAEIAYDNGCAVLPGTTVNIYPIAAPGYSVSPASVQQAISSNGEIDISELVEVTKTGWAIYFAQTGDDAANAYQITTEAQLHALTNATKTGDFATAGKFFALANDITLTTPYHGVGVYDNTTNARAFEGTFDGCGHTISGLVCANNTSGNNYRGFFNQINNATVKNLTVNGTGFGDSVPAGEYGCAMICGCANSSVISNCVSAGTITSGTHNVGGIVIRIKDATIIDCVNNADITGNYTKVAGIAVINQNSGTACRIENCVNNGTITCAGVTAKAGRDGCAGIIAYVGDAKLTIKNCSNTGAIVKGENAVAGAKIGQIVGWTYTKLVALEGTITGRTDTKFIGDNSTVTTRHFATIADNTATFIEDSAVAAGGSYKVMAAGGLDVEFGSAVNDQLVLDTAIAAYTGTVTTAVADAYVVKTVDNAVYTYTVTAKAAPAITIDLASTEAEWTDVLTFPVATVTVAGGLAYEGSWSPDAITEPADAATTNVYTYTVTVAATETTLANSATATFKVYKVAAPALPSWMEDQDQTVVAKYNTWAANNGVAMPATEDYEDAFLLNCAPGDVETAKAAFKFISLVTIPPTADDVATKAGGYNGVIKILGATDVKGPYAVNTENATFFKAVLELPNPVNK